MKYMKYHYAIFLKKKIDTCSFQILVKRIGLKSFCEYKKKKISGLIGLHLTSNFMGLQKLSKFRFVCFISVVHRYPSLVFMVISFWRSTPWSSFKVKSISWSSGQTNISYWNCLHVILGQLNDAFSSKTFYCVFNEFAVHRECDDCN